MARKKRFGVSVFMVILTLLMLCVIVFTAMINFKFSSSAKSGTLFGKHIYIIETDQMMPELDKGSAVIAESEDIQVLTEGNVILFKQTPEFENVMRIREVVHNTDSTVYKVAYDAEPENIVEIKKEKVIAKCNTESQNLGKLITFLKSTIGLIVGLLLPFVFLLVMIIINIVISKKNAAEQGEEYDEMYGYDDKADEDDEEEDSLLKKRINPLFVPDENINQGQDFEKKKSSIAKNFAQKPGAVRTKTRIQTEKPTENAVEKFKAAVEEKPQAPVTKKASLAPDVPDSDRDEKLAAIREALSQEEAQPSADIQAAAASKPKKTVEPKTMMINITDERKPDVPKRTAEIPAAAEKPRAEAPLSVESLGKFVSESEDEFVPITETRTAQKSAPAPKPKKNDDIKSIDDLIRILEEEKKKL